MRNEEACITENHHELAMRKNLKKRCLIGVKIGFFGYFPSLDTLVITLIFIFGSKSYHIRLVAVFIDKWTGIKKSSYSLKCDLKPFELFYESIMPQF